MIVRCCQLAHGIGCSESQLGLGRCRLSIFGVGFRVVLVVVHHCWCHDIVCRFWRPLLLSAQLLLGPPGEFV